MITAQNNFKEEPPDTMTFKQAPKETQNIIIKVYTSTCNIGLQLS